MKQISKTDDPRRDAFHLTQMLDYDPQSGRLTWKIDDFCMKARKGRKADGINRSSGHRKVRFRDNVFAAHRLIWLMVNKVEPTGFIIHVNGDKLDNRIENLREVEHQRWGRNSHDWSTHIFTRLQHNDKELCNANPIQSLRIWSTSEKAGFNDYCGLILLVMNPLQMSKSNRLTPYLLSTGINQQTQLDVYKLA